MLFRSFAKRGKYIGLTFFAGHTRQTEMDVDNDGLSDIARLTGSLIHPTLFFYPTEKSSVSIGWSGSFEQRTGGDMKGLDNQNDAAHPYFEKNKLNRNSFALIAEQKFSSHISGTLKATYSNFQRTINTNTYDFTGSQQNYYAEASLLTRMAKHIVVAGLNIVGDKFQPSAATPAMVGTLHSDVAGLFLQDTWQPTANTKIEGGLRSDYHQRYGLFLLPRLAIFQRLNQHWGLRGGFGLGYKSPNPLSPQIRDYDIIQIRPLAASAMPERSFGANVEGNYNMKWDADHTLFLNYAFFLTQLSNPYTTQEMPDGSLDFYNAQKPVNTRGFDAYVQLKLSAWEIYLGYTYTEAERLYLAANRFMPLVPRNRAATTLVYEIEGKWRFGVEASYNGRQYRDNDSKTPGYLFAAAMVERKFGPRFSIVLNSENLLDERQSRYEQIFSGSIAMPYYKPLWAPIDGRVVNIAFRFQPFAR